ncbi:hypothetical protein ACKI2N_023845 [Cupriavidus sp. 30B13]|uniref:hypothetical protein n=1 Tax=Cupriavidus sp. 30B13 TaxID=3384241 RepID=UPI003B915036
MTRQILAAGSGQAVSDAAGAVVPDAAASIPAATEPGTPAAAPSQALAGAFPAWDLLPAAPFVRRVR